MCCPARVLIAGLLRGYPLVDALVWVRLAPCLTLYPTRSSFPDQEEVESLRTDLARAWLLPPVSLEETAESFIRPSLRAIFLDLHRNPISFFLERHGFRSDLLKAMYATTDAFSGLSGGWDTPGTGANFLLHNMVSRRERLSCNLTMLGCGLGLYLQLLPGGPYLTENCANAQKCACFPRSWTTQALAHS